MPARFVCRTAVSGLRGGSPIRSRDALVVRMACIVRSWLVLGTLIERGSNVSLREQECGVMVE
jgi:hypothetical protein